MNAIHDGEIKGLLSICFNPLVSLPEANFTREALEKLEFFGVIDFFLSETARARRCRACRKPAGGRGRRHRATWKARVIHIQKAVDPPGDARRGFRDHLRSGPPPGPAASTSRFASRARSSTNCAWRRAAASPITTASPTRRSTQQMGVFWPCPHARPSRDAAAVRRRPRSSTRWQSRFMSTGVARKRRSGGADLPDLSDHRPRGQPVSLRDADAPHRSAGRSVPRAEAGDPSPPGGTARNRRRRLGDDHIAAAPR